MRYGILVAAVMMQMCLGATYSWSVYVQPLKELTGLQQGPVQTPFTVFYFVFPLSMLISGMLLKKKGRGVKIRELLGRPAFQVLYLAMFVGLAAGFAVNANLKEMYSGTGDIMKIGITGVSLFALANAAGRIVWGLLFDRIASVAAIQMNLFLQACVLVAAPFFLGSIRGFWVLAFLAGFNYGGVLVLYVSTVSKLWGAADVGLVYGWLFSSNIPASLSPIIAGLMFDHFHNFDLVLYILAALLLGCGLFVGRRKNEIALFSVPALT